MVDHQRERPYSNTVEARAISDPETGGDNRVLRNHDETVPDEIIVCVQVLRFAFRRNYNAIANARVLIDDCTIDHAIFPDAHWRLGGISYAKLKVIGAHNDAVANGRAALNDAANADDASLQVRVRYDAAVGNNRLPERCTIDLTARQKPRMRIDRRVGFEETVFRNHISQIKISFVECADRSDVFPVTVKDKRADVPILDRRRNNVFTEIEQIALHAFDKYVAIENVNTHRCLKQFVVFVRTNGAKQIPAHLHFLHTRLIGWFLDEAGNPSIDAALHDAKLKHLVACHRFRS